MINKKVLFLIFGMLFLVGFVSAGDYKFQNLTETDLFTIYGETGNVGVLGNVSSGGWFKGIFNWIVGSTSSDYLSFNGTQLNFDESYLNTTIGSLGDDNYVNVVGDTMTGNLNMNGQGIWYGVNGSLGLGTTAPGAKLHVNYPTSGDVIFQAGTGDGGSDMNLRYGYNGYGWYNKYLGSGSGDGNEWQLWSEGAGSTDQQVYGIRQSGNIDFKKQLTVQGDVGIGTAVPQNELNVVGDANVTGILYYGDLDGEENLNVNDSEFLDGYNSSFFMPLNTSVTGEFDFNGGIGTGVAIRGGSLYAQAAYFYNISSLGITNLNINGSLYPDINSSFDLGNSTGNWWDNLYLSGDAHVGGTLYYGSLDGEENLSVNRSDYWDDLDTISDITGLIDSQISNDIGANYSKLIGKPANIDEDSTNDLTTSTSWSGDLRGTGSSPTVINTQGLSYTNITDDPWLETTQESSLNVNSSYYWDDLNTPADINAADITDDNTYVEVIGDNMTGNLNVAGNVGIGTTSPDYQLDVNGTGRFSGDVRLDAGKNLNFYDHDASYPTSTGGFVWDLNNDNAKIYAQQPASDQIDLVFKIADNVGTTDRFVYWIDSYTGETDDIFPLYMDGTKTVFNYPAFYGTGTSKDSDFYIIGNGSTSNSQAYFFGDAANKRVGIGTIAPKNKLDVEGGVVIGATYSGTNTAPTNGLLVEGDVGIATTTPQNLLNVIGDINATTSIFSQNKNLSIGYDYATNGTLMDASTDDWVDESGDNMTGNLEMSGQGIWYAANGSLGVGTTSPDTTLDIEQGADDSGIIVHGYDDKATSWIKMNLDASGFGALDSSNGFRFRQGGANIAYIDNSASNGFRVYDDIAFSFGTSIGRYSMGYDSTSGDFMIAQDSSATTNFDSATHNKFTIQNNTGYVGIGTTSPASLLNINGTPGTLANGLTFGDGDTGIYESTDDILRIQTGSVSNYIQFLSTSFRKPTTSHFSIDLGTAASSTNPTYAFYQDENTGMGLAGTDTGSLIAGGINVLNWNASGNVGIGTTAPQNELNVIGDGNFTGTLYVNEIAITPGANISGAGTANYIPKWSDSSTLTDSSISDDGGTITIDLS